MPELRPAVLGTTRLRVTALACLALLVVLVVGSAALVKAQTTLLTESLEDTLAGTADAVADQVAEGPVGDVLVVSGDEDDLGQLVAADGVVRASTTNLAADPPLVPMPADRNEDAFTTVEGPGGVPNRVLARWVHTQDGPAVLMVGRALDDVADSRRALVRVLSVAVPLATLLLGVLVWWVVGRTLRPVETMRREAEEIGAEDLDRRLQVPGGDDEVARLARTLNAMLGRLQRGDQAQRRFVADASHELRSPLTRLRAQLEVDAAHPAEADLERTHQLALRHVADLQELVDDLLALARVEGVRAEPQPVTDLDDVVLAEARALAPCERVRVDVSRVSGAQVRGRPELLGRVVRNLLDNAVRHARSRVEVTLHEVGGRARLEVRDDGPGIPEPERERVFERFTRLDPARSDRSGAGLGLAIVRSAVGALDGTIVAAAADSPAVEAANGAVLVVEFPLAAQDTPPCEAAP